MMWWRKDFGWLIVETPNEVLVVWPYASEPGEDDHQQTVKTLELVYGDRFPDLKPEAVSTPHHVMALPSTLSVSRKVNTAYVAVYRLVGITDTLWMPSGSNDVTVDGFDRALAAIRRFCDAQTARVGDQRRYEAEVKPNEITVVEREPAEKPGDEWSRVDIALFRHNPVRDTWTLWWRHRRDGWLLYDDPGVTETVEPLIAAIKADPDSVFWG